MLISIKKANFISFWYVVLPLANMVPAYHSLAGRPHCAPFNKFKNILVLTATTRSASEGEEEEERVRDKEGAPPPPPFTASRRVRRTALSLQDLERCGDGTKWNFHCIFVLARVYGPHHSSWDALADISHFEPHLTALQKRCNNRFAATCVFAFFRPCIVQPDLSLR